MNDQEITHIRTAAGPRREWSGKPVFKKPLAPGALAGEYVLKEMIAEGGYGTVYEAEHRILGRRAAVKVLHPHLCGQGDMLQRFVREARVVSQIHHPNIVDVYDFGTLADGSPFYVMELLPARTLSQLLNERGRLSPARALAFMEPVCAALVATHQAGVVHRDLKASNVALVSEGEQPQVKLLDFGIAKLIHPEPGDPCLTMDGQRLGTNQMMAPEQIRGGPIGPATDIYALGVLLYRMLTGRYPFESKDPREVERMHLEMPPPRPSAYAPVSLTLDGVVLRCLEKEAGRRYPSVASFLSALQEAVAPPVHALSDFRGKSTHAFVLYAEGVLAATPQDDEAYALLCEALDELEQALRDSDFILAQQMGTSLLAVRLLDQPLPVALHTLLEAVREFYQRAQERVFGSGVSIHVCVHVGQVEARQGAEGLEITGGPLADTEGWVVRARSGFATTLEVNRACASALNSGQV